MKLHCILVDDNPIELDGLESLIRKIDQLHIEACCHNAIEAMNIVRTRPVDIVFSDIDMPDLKGIDLIRSLANPPVFVLVSSHTEYALEGFELDVADYVLKPYDFARISKAAGKAIEICMMRKMLHERKQEATEDSLSRADDHFMIRTENSYLKVRFEEISYIESMSNYSKIYTESDKCHIVLVSLKKVEELLPADSFMRIHRSFIIPLKRIEEIRPTEVLIGKQAVPLGTSYRQALLEQVVNNKLLNRS